ncbi:DUF1741 domain-containing protein [Mycena indigotica]|uniref:DUF1741 domain-containing protein n=1 Tax=Mycena indigotica TaxID=2126181 RepID=A0A8H6WC74_9AGAR|nr:DUF1741 domain-containing protein [Mycena indigotica]KAF7307059.1 DUF1741 domain-containing protein [Mycena indigotica]
MQLQPRIEVAYSQLLNSPAQHKIEDSFFDGLFDLTPRRDSLIRELNRLPMHACLGPFKSNLNALVEACLRHASPTASNTDHKRHALETLSIFCRCIFARSPAPTGWEVMEVMAGGVTQADTVFSNLTELICELLPKTDIPVDIRHEALRLALTFVGAIGQLSPGAYFLRRDLFPATVAFIKAPDTRKFASEAILLIAVLANYHKSKQNGYLMHIQHTDDQDLMRIICSAASLSLEPVVKAYQEVSADDDTTKTLVNSLGEMLTKFRPDRALTPTEPPRELFKAHPTEACVILLAVFEFLRNPVFPLVLIAPSPEPRANTHSPPYNIISLSSYILTHASSTSSPRTIVYANLCLNTLLALVQNDGILISFSQPTDERIRLCRQRLPALPSPPSRRPPLCALLDCCVLWLRHNLHKRFEVQSYITCLWVCYRVVWFLWKAHVRLEYTWQELWSAILNLLSFLSSKLDSLTTTGGVEQLVRTTVVFIELCLQKCEMFLPTPQAVHQFVYELVRSSSILSAQLSLLRTLSLPQAERRASLTTDQPAEVILTRLLSVTEYYQIKIVEAKAHSADRALRVVATEIERDGVHGLKDIPLAQPGGEVAEVALSRFVYSDVLALLPWQ